MPDKFIIEAEFLRLKCKNTGVLKVYPRNKPLTESNSTNESWLAR